MNGIGRKLVGQWNTKTVVGVALGAILMAIMMVYIQIPIFTQVQFSLAPVVIVIVGALFGPLPAAIAACFGNFLADMIGGWGFWFDWTIGHFFCGFITGLLPSTARRSARGFSPTSRPPPSPCSPLSPRSSPSAASPRSSR